MPTHAEVIEQLIAERDEARELARELHEEWVYRDDEHPQGMEYYNDYLKRYPWLAEERG